MIICGDAFEETRQLSDECVDCCITSPPYWSLRDYGSGRQVGMESTPEEYIENLTRIFNEVRRVLKPTGTLWLNLGDAYVNNSKGSGGSGPMQNNNRGCRFNGVKFRSHLPPKNLLGIPWRTALSLQADGWILRQDIIWQKTNILPEPLMDRCTRAHEYVFLFSKRSRYYFDSESIKEPCKNPTKAIDGKTYYTRNPRSVWTVPPSTFRGAHFATFPPRLIAPMIVAGCPEGGVVLDPFLGSGTTAVVSQQLGRRCIGIELNPAYVAMATKRIQEECGLLAQPETHNGGNGETGHVA